MNLNQWIVEGNLTRDPQVKFLPSQTAVIEFGIAANKKYTHDGQPREEVSFFDCVYFTKNPQAFTERFQKGANILVIGEGQQQRWEAQDGGKRSKVVIRVNTYRGGSPRPQQQQQAEQPFQHNDDQTQGQSDDIPL